MSVYHEGNRALQDEFDTRRLADRIEQVTIRDRIEERDREFIEARDMFFIATTDADGHPTCSYKGGDPGFVRVLDEQTLAFPNYDGNGMYLTMGNLRANPHVGLLFIDFEGRRRLRLEGVASVAEDDPLVAEFPEAQFVVRVRAQRVYPNCPRYIHQYRLVERSRFVPKTECETPVPKWKTEQWSADALPEQDPARDPSREVLWKG
jgi:predicted pyridoxine 5'-phosphate oxidase superfamily flavin-nucleotide-binding protein